MREMKNIWFLKKKLEAQIVAAHAKQYLAPA